MANKIAGIDVHRKVLMVIVIDALGPDSKLERRRFTTTPIVPLIDMAEGAWRRMNDDEINAQYWCAVWLESEPLIPLHLAQAFSNRAPRGLLGSPKSGHFHDHRLYRVHSGSIVWTEGFDHSLRSRSLRGTQFGEVFLEEVWQAT